MSVGMGRRAFLAACGAATAAFAAHGASVNREGRAWTVEELTLGSFEKWVGKTFTARHAEHGERTLRLDAAEAAPERYRLDMDGKPTLDGFSAFFSAPKEGGSLPQDTYDFVHPEAGTFSLFMTPIVSSDPERHAYQIVINRLLPQ